MRFRFLAENANGEVVRGEIDADGKSSALQNLEHHGLSVQLLQSCESGCKKESGKFFATLFRRSGIRQSWKYDFFEQLSMLLMSGLPMERCLSALIAGTRGEKIALGTICQLKEKISSGMSLSEGMMCTHVFSETEVKTVRAAEEIGRPGVALSELAEFGKKVSAIEKKIKSSLAYPAIVLTVAGFALVLLMTVVVPKFEAVFVSQHPDGKRLPVLTQFVIDLCNFLSHHFIAIFMFFVLSVVVFRICLRRKEFRRRIVGFCCRLPVFGTLVTDVSLNGFFRTAGMLMSFGVPLQDAMKLSVAVVSVARSRRAFEKILEKITHGEGLSDSFASNKLLAATDLGLIFAGEQSGNLAQSFVKIGEIYNEKIENRLAFLTTLIEPVIILLLAVVVGTVVVAMFLPMISLMENILP
ncbi:MAG: type II secretion system F family protein [Puniceicoccales bacterium]|jgi:type IV pilus assembly protein PilC|nr:type II secretion system F family protein [Puniceicoccales bacterium]